MIRNMALGSTTAIAAVALLVGPTAADAMAAESAPAQSQPLAISTHATNEAAASERTIVTVELRDAVMTPGDEYWFD